MSQLKLHSLRYEYYLEEGSDCVRDSVVCVVPRGEKERLWFKLWASSKHRELRMIPGEQLVVEVDDLRWGTDSLPSLRSVLVPVK